MFITKFHFALELNIFAPEGLFLYLESPSNARVAAGAFGFLTLIEFFDLSLITPRQAIKAFLSVVPLVLIFSSEYLPAATQKVLPNW
jgi:hypothetical protein